MKIILVRPKPSPTTIGLQHVMVVEPLELEVLASLLDVDDHPVIVDMILEKKPFEYFIRKENPDLLCLTGYITNVPEMVEYCRLAKEIKSDIITIVGGVHCEVCPEDLDHESVDYRVIRNASTIFPRLVSFLKDKSEFPEAVLRPGERLSFSELPPFDFHYPIPERKFTDRYRKKYFYIFHNKVALIKTSFGCPFSCNFCFCREITRGIYFERPLNEVIDELKGIHEKNIYIVDDDFLTSRKRVMDFMAANKSVKLNKQYLLYGRADFIVANQDVIEDFKDVGLRTVIVGIESFFDQDLETYHKNIDARTNEEAIRILNHHRIDCYATLIVPPSWGKTEFASIKEKILSLGIHYVNLQPLTPLPGTGNQVSEEDLLFPYSDFARWDLAHVSIQPEKMSVAEFYKNILKLYNSILFQPKYLMDYLKKYTPLMMWKMMMGSYRVRKQYLQKIREARLNA